jgi:hypothetical protein
MQMNLREFFLDLVGFHLMNFPLTQIVYDIEHGVQSISESEWPAFLYPQGTNPDLENDEEGLFRGYLLPRVVWFQVILMYVQILIVKQVFRQIFTSPSSALKPDTAKKGRPSKARLHHLTTVTGRTIAYTCVIVSVHLPRSHLILT